MRYSSTCSFGGTWYTVRSRWRRFAQIVTKVEVNSCCTGVDRECGSQSGSSRARDCVAMGNSATKVVSNERAIDVVSSKRWSSATGSPLVDEMCVFHCRACLFPRRRVFSQRSSQNWIQLFAGCDAIMGNFEPGGFVTVVETPRIPSNPPREPLIRQSTGIHFECRSWGRCPRRTSRSRACLDHGQEEPQKQCPCSPSGHTPGDQEEKGHGVRGATHVV